MCGDAVWRVPAVITRAPGKDVGDGSKEVEQAVGDEDVVVCVHQHQNQHNSVPNT